MKKALIVLLLVIAVATGITYAFAHSGRTDRWGCHHDRKTGTYHCH